MSRSYPLSKTGPRWTTTALAGAVMALLVLGHSASAVAGVQALLQSDNVQEGEMVNLRIESDAAQSNKRPDLTPLNADFEVLGTSTSSQTQIINGSRSDKTSWLVRLRPRHTGTLDIPSIRVGDEHTASITVQVREPSAQAKSASRQQLFLEASSVSAGKSIYVQQQIPYIARLYFDDSVQSGELVGPTSADAVVEQLGEEKRYRQKHNGREYNVIERNYAVAPEKSGTLHIAPASFRGTAIAAGDQVGSADNTNNLFAQMLRNTPFANDPAFINGLGAGAAFGNPSQPVATRGEEMTLQIEPRPAAAHGNWLPAEQITLHDSWQDHRPQFKVGEPVTRIITISAKGLAASQIPSLSLEQPGAARIYPESPDNQSRTDGKSIYGISTQTMSYIPNAQGTLEIAPVTLAWWNTVTDSPAVATLSAQAFQVGPGAAPTTANTPSVAQRPVSNAMTAVAVHNPSWLEFTRREWHWPIAALAVMLFIVASGWAWTRRRRGVANTVRRAAPDPQPARKSSVLRVLRQACASNDPHAAARALSDLGQIEWPANAPRGLGALAARLESGAEEVNTLERHLYGAAPSPLWRGEALWRQVGRGLQVRQDVMQRAPNGLDSLYQVRGYPDQQHS